LTSTFSGKGCVYAKNSSKGKQNKLGRVMTGFKKKTSNGNRPGPDKGGRRRPEIRIKGKGKSPNVQQQQKKSMAKESTEVQKSGIG